MSIALKNKAEQYAEITQIIHGKPAASLILLPQIWQRLARSAAGTNLTAAARQDYVEAAKLFRYHNTPMGREALSAVAHDFVIAQYPEFDALTARAETEIARRTAAAVSQLFSVFGYDVPASFYNIILETLITAEADKSLDLFKNKKMLVQDRLRDAVLHAMLLVTPIGLFVHSVFSQHGLRFVHMMNCNCSMELSSEPAFTIALDAELKSAYVQNMVAAAFEQYGVNAATSRDRRGF